MRKGKILKDIRINSLGYGGVGIATTEQGKKILIKGALPNSVVDCKIVKRKKDYLEAHIIEVKEMDESYVDGEVKCPHYLFGYQKESSDLPLHKSGCGGCKWQAISYEKQLQLKHQIVTDCFQNIEAEFGKVSIYDVLGSPDQFKYRNKIEFSFGKYLKRYYREHPKADSGEFEVAEHWNMGFHKQGEFSKVLDVDQCYLVSPRMHQVFEYIKEKLIASGLPVYDPKQHSGFLRHCVIREGVHTDQIMVLLSVAPKYFEKHPEHQKVWETLLKMWKNDSFTQEQITTCCIIENNGLADAVRNPDVSLYTVWGEGRIFEELHLGEDIALTFQISPFSFFQTNTKGAEVLFKTAFDLIGKVEGNILDLYCGSGTIGLLALASGKGAKVTGVEIVESAIYDAGTNATINRLRERSTFYVGKAEDVVREKDVTSILEGNDLLIVDPPRSGLHKHVISFLRDISKERQGKLLYISCNPVTMARDIGMLLEGDRFRLESLTPVDLFPHTHHIECIGVLYY